MAIGVTHRSSVCLLSLKAGIMLAALFSAHIMAAPWDHGTLRVNAGGRYLEHGDGTPFLWIGDTGWDLFQVLTKAEVEAYFTNRRQRGFTVIQCVLVPESHGTTALCEENGTVPFQNANPDLPVEKYWTWVDWVVDKAAQYGLYLALLPEWGIHVCGRNNGDRSMVIFDSNNSYRYGRFLAARYRDRRNIIWILGGDRAPADEEKLVYARKAAGIRELDTHHLITFHPSGWKSSSKFFHDSTWLDFNSYQSGHGIDLPPVWKRAGEDWVKTPIKPVLNAESAYEGICVGLVVGNPRISAYDTRKDMYRSLCCGTFGHTYGHANVAQFHRAGEGAKYSADQSVDWSEAINSQGSAHAGIAGRLLKSRPPRREPDASIVSGGLGTGAAQMGASRGTDFLFVYFPSPVRRTIVLGKIKGVTVACHWFDPRTGASTKAGEYPNSGTRDFTPPAKSDWVLVIDDAAKGYPAPGTADLWYAHDPTSETSGDSRQHHARGKAGVHKPIRASLKGSDIILHASEGQRVSVKAHAANGAVIFNWIGVIHDSQTAIPLKNIASTAVILTCTAESGMYSRSQRLAYVLP